MVSSKEKGLKEFNIWQFQIPLLSYFNYRLLNIKIYDHHKFALYLSSIIPLCEKIVHLFIHLFSEDDKNLIYHRYKYLSFIGKYKEAVDVLNECEQYLDGSNVSFMTFHHIFYDICNPQSHEKFS